MVRIRKLIAQTVVSLDGYFEGPNREIDWHTVDEDYNDYAAGLLGSVDAILFGRATYQLMESYWPTPKAMENDPVIANKMNQLPKIVFSKTLDHANWQNTRLVRNNIVDEIGQLKQQPGKDLVILGSGALVAELTRHGMIDEYQLMVNPVLLGRGNPLFKGLQDKTNLKLVHSREFSSGNVLLCYRN